MNADLKPLNANTENLQMATFWGGNRMFAWLIISISGLKMSLCCVCSPDLVHRSPRHLWFWGLREQQLRTVLHQLCQRASAALLQPAHFQAWTSKKTLNILFLIQLVSWQEVMTYLRLLTGSWTSELPYHCSYYFNIFTHFKFFGCEHLKGNASSLSQHTVHVLYNDTGTMEEFFMTLCNRVSRVADSVWLTSPGCGCMFS